MREQNRIELFMCNVGQREKLIWGVSSKATLSANFDAQRIMVNTNRTGTKKVEVAANATSDFKNISFGNSPDFPAIWLPTNKSLNKATRKSGQPICICL